MVFICIVALPALLAVPTHIAIKQFDTIYQIDKVSSPPSCFFTAANFFNLVSYSCYHRVSRQEEKASFSWCMYRGGCGIYLCDFGDDKSELLRLEKLGGESLKKEDK